MFSKELTINSFLILIDRKRMQHVLQKTATSKLIQLLFFIDFLSHTVWVMLSETLFMK